MCLQESNLRLRGTANEAQKGSVWCAVTWIADNDVPGDDESVGMVSSYLTVCLVADVFGFTEESVAGDVLAIRERWKKSLKREIKKMAAKRVIGQLSRKLEWTNLVTALLKYRESLISETEREERESISVLDNRKLKPDFKRMGLLWSEINALDSVIESLRKRINKKGK